MKKLLVLALLSLSSFVRADQFTNRLHLDLPPVGAPNWGQAVNQNFQIIDSTVNTGGGGGGGGGSTNGSIIAAPRYSLPFYSLAGTTTTLTGLTPGTSGQVLTTAGSSAAPYWSAVVTSTSISPGSTNYVQNRSSLQTGTTFYVSSGTVLNQLNLGVAGSYTDSTQNLSLTNTQSVGVFFDPATITLNRTAGRNNCIAFKDPGVSSPMAICGNGTRVTIGSQNNTGGFNSNGALVFDANNLGSSTATIQGKLILSSLTNTILAVDGSGVVVSTTITGGGTGSGGYAVQPATVAFNLAQGVTGSTFTFTGPTQSTVTYGVTVGSLTVSGTGNGNIQLTISGSTYSVTSASVTPIVGNLAVFTSTNGTIGNGGTSSGGIGNAILTATQTWSGQNTYQSGSFFTSSVTVSGLSQIITSTGLYATWGSTSTFNDSIIVKATGTVPAVTINANGTYGTVNGSSGGLLMNCTGGAAASGMCMQLYSNAGAQNALGGMLNIVNDNSAWNEPEIYTQRTSNTNNNSDIRTEATGTPAWTIIETGQVNASAGKYQMSVHNGDMRFEGRNVANTAFDSAIIISSAASYGDVAIGQGYNFSNNTQFQVFSSTNNIYAVSVTTTSNLSPYLVTISTNAAVTLKGPGVPPDSQALCLLGGQLGHCTSIIGAGGGCTCATP